MGRCCHRIKQDTIAKYDWEWDIWTEQWSKAELQEVDHYRGWHYQARSQGWAIWGGTYLKYMHYWDRSPENFWMEKCARELMELLAESLQRHPIWILWNAHSRVLQKEEGMVIEEVEMVSVLCDIFRTLHWFRYARTPSAQQVLRK